MNEFELIERYLRPLTKNFSGSLNLADDAALLEPPPGMHVVITKDAMCEGVHFLGTESPALMAKKLLRTNLSDLAAKGAAPWCYFLALALPPSVGDAAEWLQSFVAGLAEDQKEFDICLAGGDSTRSKAGIFFSITALGLVPHGGMLTRSGAIPGQGIYVSGTLGDSALGLKLAMGAHAHTDDREFLIERYILPQPRVALGQQLRTLASSCMDISDGLVQDLGHLCKASGVGAVIHAERVPLSEPAKAQAGALEAALCGGDDYELLFTAPGTAALPLGITRIGEIVAGSGVVVLAQDGSEMTLTRTGYQHF
jgi:thiamine-monophosphate kinase